MGICLEKNSWRQPSFDRKIRVLFLQLYKLCGGILRNLHFELLNILNPLLPTSYFRPEIFIPFPLPLFHRLKNRGRILTSNERYENYFNRLFSLTDIRAINEENSTRMNATDTELDIRVVVNNKPYRWTLLNNISAWIILQMTCFDRRKAFQSLSIHVHRAEINSSFLNDGLFKGKNKC